MNTSAKRQLSFLGHVAAGVIMGVVLASSTNWTPETSAQKVSKTPSGRTTAVTIPSFADIAAEATPSVVSITSTDIVRGARGGRSPFGDGGQGQDPFEFFFGFPHPNTPGGPGGQGEQEHKEE